LHEISLGAFDHTRFEHERLGTNWVSYEPLKVGAVGVASSQATVPIRHLDERDRNGIGAHMVFPNLLMASTAEFFATYAVAPVSPFRSRVDLRIRADPTQTRNRWYGQPEASSTSTSSPVSASRWRSDRAGSALVPSPWSTSGRSRSSTPISSQS
jgi:hypothetical protein